MAETIRVLVVEDHAIVRDGVCTLLEKEPDIEVVGSVGTGEEAIEFLQNTEPDIVVMDVGLPGMSGIDATRQAKESNPNLRVLALTMYTEDQYMLDMLDAGATGYLLKQSMVNNLVQAVRAVAVGQSFLAPSATRTIIESLRASRDGSSSSDALTGREREILQLIGQGCTSKEIANKLFLSPKTIENYRARILGKLQVKNCSEAVSRAIRQRIIEPASEQGGNSPREMRSKCSLQSLSLLIS